MGAKLTLEELEQRVKKISEGCGDLVGGFFEEGHPHRWHCGDIQPEWVRRRASPTGKRLCPHCYVNIKQCQKKILKLKEANNFNDKTKTL